MNADAAEFCVVPDERGLADSLGVPAELPVYHWDEAGDSHGLRWRGWQLCIVIVVVGGDEQGFSFAVITQATRPPGVAFYIRQAPGWPPQPNQVELERTSSGDPGKLIGQFWDDGLALFGLTLPRRGGRLSREEMLRTEPRFRSEVAQVRDRARRLPWKQAIAGTAMFATSDGREDSAVKQAQRWVNALKTVEQREKRS